MCHALYLGSNKKLESIKWIENKTHFCLNEENNSIIQDKLKSKYLYYCCSYQGCSCGFSFDQDFENDQDDKLENEAGKKSLMELFEFLNKNINKNEIKLYSCWEGNEFMQTEHIMNIELSKFKLDRNFHFNENEIIIINE